MVRVKICGITSLKDALAAEAAGADAIGFVFAKSPRRVTTAKARAIIKKMGPWVAKVGVFVNASASEVERTVRTCGLDAVQLHGDEPPSYVWALRSKGITAIKALRVQSASDLKASRRYGVDAFLLDTAIPGIYGGTGKSFDWAILKKFKTGTPVIVSGGLNARNIKRLLRQHTPYGVDVSSGVERSPGVKSISKVREFIRNVRSLIR